MTSLGEIVLKFGATGEDGEAPLRFKATHINLLVGPNNAGKSLTLRELSGVNPRGRERRSRRPKDYASTRIVAEVHWDDETSDSIRQDVVEAVFEAGEQEWNEIKSRKWEQLLPVIEQAIPQLTDIRDHLCSALLDLAGAFLSDWKDVFVAMVGSDTKAAAPLIISVAVILLQISRHDEISMATASSADDDSVRARRAGPLGPEQAAVILQIIEEAWVRCDEIFKSLGVDTQGLSPGNLLDRNAFGGALLMEMAKHPILKMIIAREPSLLEGPAPNPVVLERVRRFTEIGGWMIDPEPLERLAKLLREVYAQSTWSDPERRAALSKSVLYLDGIARLNVTQSAQLTAYEEDGENDQSAILSLLKEPESMALLRALTEDALGGHLVIDITSETPKAIWRLAKDKPATGLEGTYSAEASRFNAAAVRLDERSDGIHAFVGMLAAILAKSSDLVFIDEPEAFLHPPLVRQFARQISWLAREWGIQFFIATHSADLLETFATGGSEVNIIRLTHESERSTARLLDSTSLRHLARDPLLRSESALSSLFHEGAVICEAAGDRVLYKEINERLLAGGEDGLDSCVFLNAQNWGTVPRMMAPLRKMGVAAAALLDSDVLFEPGLTSVLVAAQVGKVIRDGWLKQREGLRDQIAKRTGVDLDAPEDDPEKKRKKLQLKGKTIAGLTGSEKRAFAELRSCMARYGVFIVPVGELEDWLTSLGLRPPSDETKKAKWLREALDRLGQDPQAEGYVHPEQGDIWDFMRSVNEWICNPKREGTSPTPHQDD